MRFFVIRTSSPVGGASRGDYAQEVRYIAIEHMEVRRDCFRLARPQKEHRRETRLPHAQEL